VSLGHFAYYVGCEGGGAKVKPRRFGVT
jgi:hypothetical protein